MINNTKTQSFFSIIRNIFFILIFLQFVPGLVGGIRDMIDSLVSPKIKVGYLPINGTITDAQPYTKRLDKFLKDDDVQALVLRINSPGGYAGSCQTIFSELKKFAQKKPVVALIENVGASGAYYIAVAAHKVITSPLAIVGSVGVFMQLPNVKGLLDDWKVTFNNVTSGEFKAAGSPVNEMTEQHRQYLQKLADDHYQIFVGEVAEARKLDLKQSKIWADGKVFTGREAVQLKLVDAEGSMSDAVVAVKELLKTDEDIQFVHAPRHTGILKTLIGDDEAAEEAMTFSDVLAQTVQNVSDKLKIKTTIAQSVL